MAITDKTTDFIGSKNSITTSTSNERIQSWINLLNQIDETISRPIFRLGLPKYVELAFSIPANFFGTTGSLTIGPLWFALVGISQELSTQQQQQYDESENFETKILVLRIVTFLVTIIYVGSWIFFQHGYHKIGKKLFWNSNLYPLAYPWSVGILAYAFLGLQQLDGTSNNSSANNALTPKELFSLAVYPLVLWPGVVIGMAELKNITRRSRPVTKDLERTSSSSEHWIKNKKFPLMTYTLYKNNRDQSFPSGDVAMAVLVALPFWKIGFQRIAIGITLLSALGRMYVLAHHLSDVISGFLLTFGIHSLAAFIGYEMDRVEWWHPFVSLGCYAVLRKVTGKGANPMDKQGGKNKEE